MGWRPWREAWGDALYGPHGFYRRVEGPAGHFTTSTHGQLGALLATALGTLADRIGATSVVDIGCGRGELLTHLATQRPDLRLVGVDVVARPPSLPDTVGWEQSLPGQLLPDGVTDLTDTLVLAHEWLDVIPCMIAEVDEAGVVREVEVDRQGRERLGGPVTDADLSWCATHWPLEGLPAGTRVEVGLARDEAWRALLARVRSGTVVAVDYGHTQQRRPLDGTLTAYRQGDVTTPVPDGTCDLTAHVAMDSLGADSLMTQRVALRDLDLSSAAPSRELALAEPAEYLAALARHSAVAALIDPGGLGGFWWAVHGVRAD